MQNIKAKDVIAYATMPRVVPRLKKLFTSGFGYISFWMAQVYSVVRLLPNNHPYLDSANIGRFGIRHVVAQAAGNLNFSFKNIDQIIVFFALLLGIVIFVVQFALMAYGMLIAPSFASMFDTTAPQLDIAFTLLDQIFGVPGIYCSTSTPALCTDYAGTHAMPMPFQVALHGLFEFYSKGLLLIGVLIFLYFLVVVVIETTVTGTPFGQRFQNFWVPIRLVVAIGLLMPIQYGLNSGQYIVLYAAKYASGFATTGWRAYNKGVADHDMFSSGAGAQPHPLGERYSFLALPEAPDIAPLVEAMSLVHACAYAYHRENTNWETDENDNVTRGNGFYQRRGEDYTDPVDQWDFEVQPFFIKNKTAGMVSGQIGSSVIHGNDETRWHIMNQTATPYFSNGGGSVDALGFYYGSDIIIRFGEFRVKNSSASEPVYKDETGYVKPICGDIRIPISDLTDPGGSIAGPSRGGASQIQNFYYDLVLKLWFDAPELMKVGAHIVELSLDKASQELDAFCGSTYAAVDGSIGGFVPAGECEKRGPSTDWRSGFVKTMKGLLKQEILDSWENYVLNSVYADFETEVLNRGWGGAGIWYNKIAEINGGWMDGVRGVPYMDSYPLVMEQVKQYKQQHTKTSNALKLFEPSIAAASGEEAQKKFIVDLGDGALNNIGKPLYQVFRYWNSQTDGKTNDELNNEQVKNAFLSAFNLLLGTTGLVSIRGANQHLHPMAQLVAVGKGLVNSAVFNMAGATSTAFLGGMLKSLGAFSNIAGLAEAASGVFYATAFLGLTAGFVLFYVLPFMPFLYFYFAVANWVKAIFEAMVGVPLWALAHMRIDGEGLPGDAAANGYFLIMEIFLRPILTVIGLLAAIIIFSTQVRIMNILWDMVTANAAGFTEVDDIMTGKVGSDVILHRGILDQFFFTVIYTIVAYMLAMSSFKLIDKIPDNILRWAGAGVSAYGDIDQDNVESLSRYAAVGGMTIGSQATGAIRGAAQGLGGVVGTQLKEFAATPAKTTPTGQ